MIATGRDLLSSDEQWLNIPPVLRTVVQGLHDEQENSKRLIDLMRREQRESSDLLKRIIQKQTDLEIDVARTTLFLQNPDSGYALGNRKEEEQKLTEVQRKVRKLTDHVKNVEAQLSEKETQLASLFSLTESHSKQLEIQREATAGSSARLQSTQDKVDVLERVVDEKLHNHEVKAVNSLAEAEKRYLAHVETLTSRMDKAKDRIQKQTQSITNLEEKQLQLSRNLDTVSTSLAGRVNTLVTRVGKLKTASEAAVVELEEKITALSKEQDVNTKQLRTDLRQNYTELRKTLGALDQTVAESNEHLESIVKMTEADLISLFQSALNEATEMHHQKQQGQEAMHAGALKDVEDQVNKLRIVVEGKIAADRDAGNTSLTEQKNQFELLSLLRSQIQSVEARVVQLSGSHSAQLEAATSERETLLHRLHDVRDGCKERVDGMQEKVTALTSTVTLLQQQRAADDVERRQLREAVQKQEAKTPRSTSTSVPETASQRELDLERAERKEQALQTRRQVEEVLRRVATIEEDTHALDTAIVQLRTTAAKLPPPSPLPPQQPSQDSTAALVELDAVKRRVAALELDRNDAVLAESHRHQSERRESLLLRDRLCLDDIQQDVKRTQLETGRCVARLEQQVAALRDSVRQGEQDARGTEEAVSKVSSDMTHLLEHTLRSTESIAALRTSMAGELEVVRRSVQAVQAEVEGCKDRIEMLSSPPPPAVPHTAERKKADALREAQQQQRELLDRVRDLEEHVELSEVKAGAQVAELQRDVQQVRERIKMITMQLSHEHSPDATEQRDGWRQAVDEGLEDVRKSIRTQQTLLQEETGRLHSRMNEVVEHVKTPTPSPPRATAVEPPAAVPTPPPPPPPTATLTAEEVRELLHEAQVQQQRALTRLELQQSAHEGQLQQVGEQTAFLETKRAELSHMVERNQKAVTQLAQVVELYEERLQLFETERTNAAAERKRRSTSDVTEAQLVAREADLWRKTTQLVERTAAELRGELAAGLEEAARRSPPPPPPPATEATTAPLSEEAVYERVLQWLQTYLAAHNIPAEKSPDEEKAGEPQTTTTSGLPEPDRESATAEDLEALREQLLTAVLQVKEELEHHTYPRAQLEERLENLWESVVSLLARKDDQESVNKKLEGLRRLLSEEVDMQSRKWYATLENRLEEKVSVEEVQQMLQQQYDEDL